MARRSEFLDFVIGQMAGLGTVTARAMFGGYGLYCDGLFIAIIAHDTLYFKADALSQPHFEARGLARFQYQARGKTLQLMYYAAPPEVHDEPQAMIAWGQLALTASVRARRPAHKTPG